MGVVEEFNSDNGSIRHLQGQEFIRVTAPLNGHVLLTDPRK